MKLRKYQQDAIKKVLPLIGTNREILISMATGTGQLSTIIALLFRYFSKDNNKKILFIVNRKQIYLQAKKNIYDVFQNIKINTNDIDELNENTNISLTTRQKLVKNDRYKAINKKQFDVIVYYQCESLGIGQEDHIITRVRNHFVSKTDIGIDHFVEKSSKFFGDPVFKYSMEDAIRDKYLLNYRVSYIDNYEISNEYLNDSVYATEILDRHIKSFEIIADAIIDRVKEQKTIIFCPNISYATTLTKSINKIKNSKIRSKAVVSDLAISEINHIVQGFRNDSQYSILISVDLLASGFDFPNVKNIVFLRNYPSISQVLQLLSRFLRPYEGKDYLNVLDFVGLKAFENDNPESRVKNYSENDINENKEDVRIVDKTNRRTRTEIIFRDKKSINGVLGVSDLAEEVSHIISNMPSEQGRMIGVFGKWGRGKTFLINEAWKTLQKYPSIKRVDFHAWKYQETPALWAYLYENFASSYYNSVSSKWKKFCRRIKLNRLRLGNTAIFWFFLSLLLTSVVTFLLPISDKISIVKKIISIIGIPLIFNLGIIFFKYKNSARELFKEYYTKTSFTSLLGVQAEVQKELKHLIKAWCSYNKNLKILLFVDDIDRCHEEKIIQLIDSLRIMLDDEELSDKLVVVTAIDERILKRAIKIKYSPIINDPSINTINTHILVSEYLDKLFITSIKLGDLTSEEKDEFFKEFTKKDRIESELISYNQLYGFLSTSQDYDKSKINNDSNESLVSLVEDNDYLVNDSDESLIIDNDNIEAYSLVHDEEYLLENQEALNVTNKLSTDEINLLRRKLKYIDKVTPRQIRIFYYRYLIAKNLLIRQYSKLGKKNIWVSSQYSFVIVDLLIIFSKHENSEMILEEKEKVDQYKRKKIRIIYVNNIEVDSLDYRVLLNILDTVIGY